MGPSLEVSRPEIKEKRQSRLPSGLYFVLRNPILNRRVCSFVSESGRWTNWVFRVVVCHQNRRLKGDSIAHYTVLHDFCFK